MYVDIVISNAFNLNKSFSFSFLSFFLCPSIFSLSPALSPPCRLLSLSYLDRAAPTSEGWGQHSCLSFAFWVAQDLVYLCTTATRLGVDCWGFLSGYVCSKIYLLLHDGCVCLR